MASLSDVSLDRGLPASVEAERSILGAILLDNHSYNEAAEKLRAEDFSLDSHRRIYSRMSELIDARRAVDIVTLAEELGARKEVEAMGGVAYLASLTEGLPRRPSIEEYVRIVKDKSLSRQLINICRTAITRAADQSEEALVMLDAAEIGLLEVSERGITRGFAGIPEIVRDSFGTIDNLYAQQKEVTGLATHLHPIRPHDQRTADFGADHHCRPPLDGQDGVGDQHCAERGGARWQDRRRLFARNVQGVAAAAHAGFGGAGRSAEDSDGLSSDATNRGKLWRHWSGWWRRISLSTTRPASRSRKCGPRRGGCSGSDGGLDLIVIDYLQLMTRVFVRRRAQQRYENRTQEVSAISRGLKALAKEMNIPVIALSQLRRASEQRGGDKKPMLSDLRESGSIEQDADVVAFIHRDSYYNRDENGEDRSRLGEQGGDYHRQAAQWSDGIGAPGVPRELHAVREHGVWAGAR